MVERQDIKENCLLQNFEEDAFKSYYREIERLDSGSFIQKTFMVKWRTFLDWRDGTMEMSIAIRCV